MALPILQNNDISDPIQRNVLKSSKNPHSELAVGVAVVYNPAAVVDSRNPKAASNQSLQEDSQVRETQSKTENQNSNQILFPLAVGAIFVISLLAGALIG